MEPYSSWWVRLSMWASKYSFVSWTWLSCSLKYTKTQISKENTAHESRDIAKLSNVVADMIEEDDDYDGPVEFSCRHIRGAILKKVVDFCCHHEQVEHSWVNLYCSSYACFGDNITHCSINVKSVKVTPITTPLHSMKIEEIVQPWYGHFVTVNVDEGMLFELMVAANYFDIEPLINLTWLAISIIIKVGCVLRGSYFWCEWWTHQFMSVEINNQGKTSNEIREMFGVKHNVQGDTVK